MQPHSMAAVGLANLVWNHGLYCDYARFLIKFKNRGDKLYYYDVKDIDYSKGRFSASIGRSGGGQPCIITAKIDHNEKVEMTHGTQHVAGLVEKFKLEKDRIKDGEHKNSRKYDRFSGKINRKTHMIELNCDVKVPDRNAFISIPYDLTVDSYRLKNTFPNL